MKKLILILAAVFAIGITAQGQQAKMSMKKILQKSAEANVITSDEQAKMQAAFDESLAQKAELNKTDKDGADKKAAIKEIEDNRTIKFKEILGEKKFKEWQKFRTELVK